jgi:hypothetical protein
MELMKFYSNGQGDRKQRVKMNGKSSNWESVLGGIPHRGVLGPELFLIFTNDLPDI